MYDPPGGRGFWARKSDLSSGNSSFYRVTSMFVASSANAIVYKEANQDARSDVPKSSVDALIAAFENNIVPVEHLWFATPTDVDSNRKVILLLLDIQDGYQPGGGYIAGYFDPFNHYTDLSVNSLNSKYHSNQAEMLYLDTYPADVTKTSFLATLAHEYQHLLQFGKYYRGEQADLEATWVDEGLAEVSSDLTGFGPQLGRVNNLRSAFLNGTSLIKEPSSFYLENYAVSYMYFRYLADVYGLGGIAAVFNNTQVGVAGVNSALQGLDGSLLTNCGNTAALASPYFGCSYRMMWAAMIKGTPGTAPTGAVVKYNGGGDSTIGAGGSYDYALKPANSSFTAELESSLAYAANVNGYVSGTVATGALQSYSPKLYKINPNPPLTPIFNCTTCGMTMVVGASTYVVFNHDVSTSVTHAASVTDSSIIGQVAGPVEPASPTETNSGEGQSERKALHWHFPLHKGMREFLTPQGRPQN